MVAAVLLAPASGGQTRRRIRDMASCAGDALRERVESLGNAAGDVLEKVKLTWREEQIEASQTMNGLKGQAKEKIDNAADAAKTAIDQASDTAKNVAHWTGKKMEERGKALQNA